MTGKLFVCATPIGNLKDITLRTLEALKDADLIAAEDTRHTIKILNHYDIKTPLTSYHEHNKYDKAKALVAKMLTGTNVALVSDAGTPAISDPGEVLVRMCHEAGIETVPLPGACALVTALCVCGLSTRRFVFEGFLPPDKKERKDVLSRLKNETRTIVIYEAPHHIAGTLRELFEELGERNIRICRELTKVHESVTPYALSEAAACFEAEAPKGEIVLVIEGKNKDELAAEERTRWDGMSLEEHVAFYISKGNDEKEAMRLAAKDRGLSRRDVYNIVKKR